MENEFEFKYEIITEEEDVNRALAELGNQDTYGIDCETTGLNPRENYIIGISLASPTSAFYFTKDALIQLMPRLKITAANPDKLFVFHNAVFDLHFLALHDIHFAKIADTMIASFMVDENRAQGLKPLSEHYLNISVHLPTFKEMQKTTYEIAKAEYKEAMAEYRRVNPAGGTPLFPKDEPPFLKFNKANEVSAGDIPLGEFGKYAALDARLTYDLWQKLIYLLEKDGVTNIFWEKEMPYIPIIFEMEKVGMGIDRKRLFELEGIYKEKLAEALGRFKAIAGDINPDSDQQLAKYLYEERGFPVTLHTEKNKAPSVAALALQRLLAKDSTGVIEALLDYRVYQKVLSTYVLPFIELVNLQDTEYPRIFGSYNQIGTVTGRLSSSDPNLQNVPARHETGAEIRELFISRPGYSLVDCDYSQLELRILAHYANDSDFMKLFEEGGDPHQATADLVGVERRIGKTLNFAWVYGAGPGKLCDTIEKEGNPRPKLSDARSWISLFEERRPALTGWRDKVIAYAKRLGYVRTIAGRRRHLPDLKSYDNETRSRAERQSVNTIIQGSASDIIKYASVNIKKEFVEKNIDAFFIAQVHDELLFEVKDEQLETAKEIIQRHMVQAGKDLGIRTPLEASPGVGKNWKEAH